jgi:hypothetical protein
VADELGRLYNKEAILQFKLSMGDQPADRLELMSHIRGLKDVTELKLSKTPGFTGNEGMDDVRNRGLAPFSCPILSNIEMNGFCPFVYYLRCGCAVSEKAYKEAPSVNCLSCDTPCADSTDVITICPNVVTDATLRAAMVARRRAAKEAKKLAKKEKALMPAPALPGGGKSKAAPAAGGGRAGGAEAGAGAGETAGDGDGGTTSSSKRKAALIEARAEKMARVAPTVKLSNSALSAVRSIPDQVKHGAGTKLYKDLFTSSRDPSKNMQNGSIGSYTARSTMCRF